MKPRTKRILISVIIIVLALPVYKLVHKVWVVYSVVSVTHAPEGYLVPTPASLPDGMMSWGPYFPYSADGYALAYAANSDHTSRLTISEFPENAEWNYEGLIHNYQLSVQQSQKWRGYEKVKDIDYLGAHGVLFHTLIYGSSGYDLIMDDNKKILRIEAQDGPIFHFTVDMIMNLLNGLVRQK